MGRFPPLGVNVTDKATGKDVGLVAEDGFVYLSGIQENSILHLTWVIIPVKSRPNQSNISESAQFYLVKQSNNSDEYKQNHH